MIFWAGSALRILLMPCLRSFQAANASAALARAVIVDPDVILADEPTGNVDWEMSLRILTLLVELNKMGKTILVATHDLNLIRQPRPRSRPESCASRNTRCSLRGPICEAPEGQAYQRC